EDRNSESAGRSGYQYRYNFARCDDRQASAQAGGRRRTALQHLLGSRWPEIRKTQMSRIGRKPIPLPDKVKVDIHQDTVVVTGPKERGTNPIPPGIRFEQKDNELHAIRQDDSGPQRAFHGLARALIANAVRGVT